jgi:hypothetical protein
MFSGIDVTKKLYRPNSLHFSANASRSKSSPVAVCQSHLPQRADASFSSWIYNHPVIIPKSEYERDTLEKEDYVPMGHPQPASKYSCKLTSPGVGKTSQLIASPATAAIPESHNHSKTSKLASTPACSGVCSAAYVRFCCSENVFHSGIQPVLMNRISPFCGTTLWDLHISRMVLKGME